MTLQKPTFEKAAALILNEKGKLLIAKKRGKDTWISIGGRIEAGESDEDCLRRVIEEELSITKLNITKYYCETGVEFNPHKLGETLIVRFYLVDIQEEAKANFEIEAIKWISLSEVDEMSNKLASGLVKFAIPNLVQDSLMR
ncbi:MAG: NUDIX domain-containing protein [Candidatus Dojkabacteria bacterium]|nr:NUDIX domain-containing protein [Candidatus Dojkabacteria bacterium]MDQ7020758.1 NUDIX domain-containing protein [Candidatus Dojkabacteria bacterium]